MAAADVTLAPSVQAAVAQIQETLGPCDIMIANAGVLQRTPGWSFDAAAVDAVIRTNVLGVTNSFAAVLPEMVAARRGHIVAVASIAAMLGLPGVGAYSASKAAVVTLMQSLSVDLHRYGVKTTTICPGFIDTPLLPAEERRRARGMMSVEFAAERTAWAIERGRREYWFPRRTWLAAWIGKHLPHGLYRRVMAPKGGRV